jgi:putative flippase GtrA
MENKELSPDEKQATETIAKKEKKRTSKGAEVFRFIVVGVLCSAIDFLIQYLFGKIFSTNLALMGKQGDVTGWGSYVSTAIGVSVGFIVSMIVNFILSRCWVFQNVEKGKNYNTPKYFWTYALLAFGGLLIGIGIQCLCVYICNVLWNFQITLDPYGVSMGELIVRLFTAPALRDWAFIIVFCIKTLIVLFYNYFTRKKLIFKEPKPVIEKAEDSLNHSVIGLTYSDSSVSFDKTPEEEAAPKVEEEKKEEAPKQEANPTPTVIIPPVQPKEAPIKPEEVSTVYCPPQFNWGKPVNKKSAEEAIYASLEIYDKRKTSVTNVKKTKKVIVDEIYKADDEKKAKKLGKKK